MEYYHPQILIRSRSRLQKSVVGSVRPGQKSERAQVLVTAIHRDPTQPREQFKKAKLKELGASIKKIGLVQPIFIRPHPDAKGEFMIIEGEYRWRAMQFAGIEVAKVEIFHTTDEKAIAAIRVAEKE